MRYRGEFNQLGTNSHYEVTISIGTDRSSTPTQVTLGANPIKVTYPTGDMYKAGRYSKATVQVRTDDYMMSVYAKGAQDVKVELTSGGSVVWTGYATPNLYNMGFAYQRNTIELELVDALSTLRYFPYERSQTPIVSFLDILNKCVARAGAYTAFYFSANTQRAASGTTELLSKLYISEQNFFDEKDDAAETDADVAWNYKDVLESICTYMGVTAMAIGDEVFFVDYDAIGAGDHRYYRYDVGATSGTLVTRGAQRTLAQEDYSGNGSSISLDQVYNKVRVKASLYDFEEIVPSALDEDFLENVTLNDSDGEFEGSKWTIVNMGTTQQGKQLKVMTESNHAKYKNFMRYFKNPFYVLHQYQRSGSNLVESSQDAANYTRSMNVIGAYIVGASVNGVSEYSQAPANVSFTNYICIRWNSFDGTSGQGRNNLTADDKYPMIESNDTSDVTAFFGGDNAYIIIQGKVRCLAVPEGFPPGDTRVDDKKHNNFGDRMWLPAELRLGDYYWNGTSWQSSACKFKLPFSEADRLDTGNDDDSDGGLNADQFYNKDFNFRNTVVYEDGLEDDGYAISLAGLPLTVAKPKLTVYNPHHMIKDNSLDSVWISGLKVIAAIGNPENEDKDSDTEYVNVIDNGSVSAMNKVEFKICTWDNKKPNYSAPAYLSGSTFTFVDKLFNRACQTGENSWENFKGEMGANGLRQEEHMIYRLVNQYQKASIVLKLPMRANHSPLDRYAYNLAILQDKKFVITGMVTDYKDNTTDVTFVEKF